MRNRLYLRKLDRYIVPVLVLAGWEVFARSGALPAALLPAPSTVLWAWADWIFHTDGNTQTYSGHWVFDMAASFSRVLAGFAIATALAVALGVAIGWSRATEVVIEPTLQMLRPIPPVSWIPLAIIWFGIANKPAIFLVFLGAFFPILLNTIHGVHSLDGVLIRAGRCLGASESRLLLNVILPGSLPHIFTGLAVGMGVAWVSLIAAEMISGQFGVGYFTWEAYSLVNYPAIVLGMITIGVLGLVCSGIIRLCGILMMPWLAYAPGSKK